MTACAEALSNPCPPQPDLPVVFVVAALLIDPDGRLLVTQRPPGKSMAGLWEFPGGKVEPGEIPEYALMRELREELGIETRPTCFYPLAFTSHSYEQFHLFMPLYACRAWKGVPRPREGQNVKWISGATQLSSIDFVPADLPLVTQIQDRL